MSGQVRRAGTAKIVASDEAGARCRAFVRVVVDDTQRCACPAIAGPHRPARTLLAGAPPRALSLERRAAAVYTPLGNAPSVAACRSFPGLYLSPILALQAKVRPSMVAANAPDGALAAGLASVHPQAGRHIHLPAG